LDAAPGRLNEAALLCVAALGIEIVNPILKLMFHRPRPRPQLA
jgi:hypothetical protein